MLCFTSPSPFNCSFQATEREVIAALGKGEPDEVMSSAFKLRVTREDIRTLRNLCWLNDEVKLAAAQGSSNGAFISKYPFTVYRSLCKVIW